MAPSTRDCRTPSMASMASMTSAGDFTSEATTSAQRAQAVWEHQQHLAQLRLQQSLPCCFATLFGWLIRPLFVPGEPFNIYVRKVAVLTQAIMVANSPAMGVWLIITSSVDDYGWTSKRWALLAVCFLVSVQHVVFNYIYMRRTKSCPTWLADAAIFGAETALFIMTTFILPIDSRSLGLCSLLVAALMSTKLLPLHAAIHGLLYMLHHFRSYYQSTIPWLEFSWDKDDFSMAEKLVYTFISSFPAAMAVVGLFVIVTGYISKSREAQVTNVMTITIADQLQRYDTTAMKETIKEHSDDVNSKLLEAFAGIRKNLDSYRPHIPRYLIDAAIERAEEAESNAPQFDLEGSQFPSGSSPSLEMSEGSIASDPMASTSSNPRHFLNGSGSPTSPMLARPDSVAIRNISNFNGTITSVYLRLIDFDASPTLGDGQFVAASDLNHVVEELNNIASTTSASVHHVEDGVMMATWNATKRTGNHEIRACSFAVKAMQMLQEHPCFSSAAAAAIISCKGSAHFAGTTQKHFILSHEDIRRHQHFLKMAAQHKTIVCSPSVVRNAEMQFVFGGFALDIKGKLMYELVEPRQDEVEDEWLYALHSQQIHARDPYCKLTTAAVKLLAPKQDAGRLPGISSVEEDQDATAMELLEQLPDTVCDRATVQHLIDATKSTISKTKRRQSNLSL